MTPVGGAGGWFPPDPGAVGRFQHESAGRPSEAIGTGRPAPTKASVPMSIITSAPHGRTLEALSRVATLFREHRDEIPPVNITVSPNGRVRIQVTSADTFDEATRVSAVDYLAGLLHLDSPAVIAEDTYGTDVSHGLWHVFTFVRHAKCPTCQKPVVR